MLTLRLPARRAKEVAMDRNQTRGSRTVQRSHQRHRLSGADQARAYEVLLPINACRVVVIEPPTQLEFWNDHRIEPKRAGDARCAS